MKVLIADDHDSSREVLRRILAGEGHDVIEASDGQDALEKLASSLVDAVICDILMPRIDGYRLVYETRSKPNLQNLPIIIYSSTYTSPADESAALNVGADRFLRKPSPAGVILRTLLDVTSQPRNASPPGAPARELQVLKHYSEHLVQRLEEKNVEIEAAHEELFAAYGSREESEKRFRELVERAPIGIFQTAPDGRFLAVNTAFARMLGYSSHEKLTGVGRAQDVFFEPGDHRKVLEEFSRSEEVSALEVKLKKQDGTPLWVEADGRAVKDPTGKILRYEVFALDLTKRKRWQNETSMSEERYRLLFDNNPQCLWVFDEETLAFLAVNEAACVRYGYTRDEFLAMRISDIRAPEDVPSLLAKLADEPRRLEHSTGWRHRLKDGTVIEVEITSHPLDFGGRPAQLVLSTDVTERKRSEQALRTSEARKRAVLEASLDAIITVDETGRVIEANPATERTFGWPASEMVGRELAELIVPPALRETLRKGLERHHQTGEARILGQVLELSAMRRGGEEFPVELVISAVEVEGARHFVGYIHDLTDRKKAERATRRSEERFRRLFDSNTIGIAVADLTGAVKEANDAYLDMMGYTREDLRSGTLRWDEGTPPEYRAIDEAALEALRRTGVAPSWEKEMLRKDGTRIPVLLGVAMLEASEASCIAYIVDLSKSRLLENQLRQAQKMEAVGQLAGGVAHDFNNLLTVILGYTELAATRMAGDPIGTDELEEIRKAGERAVGLTRQLLAFSRRQILAPRVLDLNVIVAELQKMLRRLIGEDLEVVTSMHPSLGRVRADAGEIEQVIVNLAVNARDAMPEGGKIAIETANVEFDEADAKAHLTMRPGRYVMLAVSDSGIGMDAETQSHIFEPFFTTKGKDKGTGLGLSTVYGIVKQSGGWVWVYSEPGRGTTVKVYLPEVDEAPDTVRRIVDEMPTGGSETVLLVEDDAPVRKLARKALEDLGYTVLEAALGEDALSIAGSHSGPIHIVVTDVVMPGMGGADLASRVQELRPEARVLYMSGYTDDAVIRLKVLERGTPFLQKPFTRASLARKVREALS